MTGERQRAQKALAAAGVASRRVCEEMIEDGRILINGVVATLGDKVDTSIDELRVDGAIVSIDPTRRTVLLNKPVDVISTAADTHDRQTVVDLVPSDVRLYPVGRLDADSEGLILLTNDGGLTQRLTHPSYGIEKEYLVSVTGSPSRWALRELRQGVELEDGRTSPAKVSELQAGLLRIVIHEGKNRQVRRMCAAVGHDVTRLVRSRIGPITDTTLKPGEWRDLTAAEVRLLEADIVGDQDGENSPESKEDTHVEINTHSLPETGARTTPASAGESIHEEPSLTNLGQGQLFDAAMPADDADPSE